MRWQFAGWTGAAFFVVMSTLNAADSLEHRLREITLERTQCFGRCPQYKLTIRSDGSALYEGKADVKETETKVLHVNRSDVERLVHKVNGIRFFDLKQKYDSLKVGDEQSGGITDVPSCVVTAVDENGTTKMIEDRWGAPKGLYELEQMIDRITNVTALTGESRPDDDLSYYDEFPFDRTLTLRGILEGARHDFSPNDVNPRTFYEFNLPKNYLSFEFQTAKAMDLSEFGGWVVDATGKLTKRGRSHDYVFIAYKIQRVRRWDANVPNN
jgi:hypothetical protein